MAKEPKPKNKNRVIAINERTWKLLIEELGRRMTTTKEFQSMTSLAQEIIEKYVKKRKA